MREGPLLPLRGLEHRVFCSAGRLSLRHRATLWAFRPSDNLDHRLRRHGRPRGGRGLHDLRLSDAG